LKQNFTLKENLAVEWIAPKQVSPLLQEAVKHAGTRAWTLARSLFLAAKAPSMIFKGVALSTDASSAAGYHNQKDP
jgi:hypothetical protein